MMMRREFVAGAAGAGAALALFPPGLAGIEREKGPGGLERRALGRTGEKLSIVGFGGVVVAQATPEQASRRVGEAIDAGVNYFDVAPSYGDAEQKLGPALAPWRKGVFLACKTQARTRAAATAELEASLAKLRTDHFDLYQHHAVTKRSDVETILGPGGAMEAFEAARKAGKVRFLGFSAHSVEAALALVDGYAFDSILFPFSYASWHAGGFGPQVLARAREKGIGILCLKAMAKGPWPEGAVKRYAKCWYEPLDTPEQAARAALRAVAPRHGGDPARRRDALRDGAQAGRALRAAHARGGRGGAGPGPRGGAALPLPERGGLSRAARRRQRVAPGKASGGRTRRRSSRRRQPSSSRPLKSSLIGAPSATTASRSKSKRPCGQAMKSKTTSAPRRSALVADTIWPRRKAIRSDWLPRRATSTPVSWLRLQIWSTAGAPISSIAPRRPAPSPSGLASSTEKRFSTSSSRTSASREGAGFTR